MTIREHIIAQLLRIIYLRGANAELLAMKAKHYSRLELGQLKQILKAI